MVTVLYAESNYFRLSAGKTDRSSGSTGQRRCGLWSKIHASPMCTEYHAFEHGHKTRFLGYKGTGEVVEVAQPGKVEIGDRVVIMPQYPCGRCSLCIADDYIHCYNFLLQWVGTRKLHYGTVYLEAVMDVAKDSSRCLLRLGLVSLLCIRIILQCVRENEGGFIQHSLNYRSWPRRFGRNYQRLISWSKSVCGGRSSMANGMCTTNECRCCRQSI